MTDRIQKRGNCQVCGRDQAVGIRGVAKHGYTVENGWFVGTCSGSGHKPMQEETTVTEAVIEEVEREVATLLATIAAYEAGTKHPVLVLESWRLSAHLIPWAEASEGQRRDGLARAIREMKHRAQTGERFVAHLRTCLLIYPGKPLREVKVEPAPAPVQVGERRYGNDGRVLKAVRVERGRVYWRFVNSQSRSWDGWDGLAKWRAREMDTNTKEG